MQVSGLVVLQHRKPSRTAVGCRMSDDAEGHDHAQQPERLIETYRDVIAVIDGSGRAATNQIVETTGCVKCLVAELVTVAWNVDREATISALKEWSQSGGCVICVAEGLATVARTVSREQAIEAAGWMSWMPLTGSCGQPRIGGSSRQEGGWRDE